MGAVPLDAALATGAGLFVEDWMFCHARVRDLRANPESLTGVTGNEIGAVGFDRRHGEWLACVAAVWLEHKYPGARLQRFYQSFARVEGDKYMRDIERVRVRMERIEKFDGEILSDLTRRQMNRFLAHA